MQTVFAMAAIAFSLVLISCHQAPHGSKINTNVQFGKGIDGQIELSPEIDYFRENFKDQKVKIRIEGSKSFLRSGGADQKRLLQSGLTLTALVDNECLQDAEGDPGALSELLNNATPPYETLSVQAHDFTLSQDQSFAEFVQMVDDDPCIIGVGNAGSQHAHAVPNDNLFAISAHHDAANLATAEAWDWFYEAQKGIKNDVVIAILDTGIRRTHGDIAANAAVVGGTNGFDFVNNDNDPTDDNGHGTHVAGISGGVANNGVGIAGVMGMRAKLMGIKVLNAAGSGNAANIINGINFAAANGAKVLNMSFGARFPEFGPNDDPFPTETAAIQNAVAQGAVVVISAGNDNINVDQNMVYPATLGRRIAGVITVGSLDSATRTRSSFSNFGVNSVEVFAPGSENSFASPFVGILSSYFTADNVYARLSGTSMSAPVVAGAAGLAIGMLVSNGINPTPAQIENLILASAPANPALNGLAKDSNSLQLRELAIGLANTFAAADPRRLTFTTQPVAVTAKEGENATLTAAISSFPPQTSAQWQKQGVNIPGATGNQLTLTNLQPGDLADYRLVANNGFIQTTSNAVRVNVLFRPRVLNQITSVLATLGGAQILSVDMIANPAPAYQWYFNGQVLDGKTQADLSLANLDWPNRGNYTLRITNSEGTTDSQAINLQFPPLQLPKDGGIENPLQFSEAILMKNEASK